jgi:hypothetical protein
MEIATFGVGEPHPISLTSDGDCDIFIAKYNSDGTCSWAKKAGGTGFDAGGSISTLTDGSCLVTGSITGTATFGVGEAHPISLISDGSGDIFIAKYNSDGTCAWAKRAGGTGDDQGRGISTLADGSCLITGYFSSTAIFGAGEANSIPLVSTGQTDIFIVRCNANGSFAP